jgi:16S rRNA (guanine966-N2)-methyltransferase
MRKSKSRLRIIGGNLGGQNIRVDANPRLRPTTAKARETLFNWLMHDIADRRCLDLFAGSGALGFEAMSRGASAVTFVDHHARVCRQLWQTIEQFQLTHAQVIQASLPQHLLKPSTRAQDPYTLVFIDPPYHQGFIKPCVEALNDSMLLAPDALVYLEYEAALEQPSLPKNWQLLKSKVYSDYQLFLYIVQKKS